MWFLTVFLSVVAIIIVKLINIYSFWRRNGVASSNILYSFDNYFTNIFRVCPSYKIIEKFYNANKDKRYFGMYNGLQPVLVITDPDLVRRISINDFNTFPDHVEYARAAVDSFYYKNINAISYEEGWSTLKSILGPFFTISKLRLLVPIIQNHADDCLEYLGTQGDTVTIDSFDVFSKYTMDAFGDTALSVRCNSYKDRSNLIWLLGQQLINVSAFNFYKYLLDRLAPIFLQMSNVKVVSSKTVNTIRKVVSDSLKNREGQKLVRPDLLQLLVEAKQSKHLNSKTQEERLQITDDLIDAQIAIFNFAASSTVAKTLSVLCHELAIHPEIQKKLSDEVDGVPITYEALHSLKYLDKVISEILRRHSGSGIIERKSVKPYVIIAERDGEKDLHLDKGSIILIPYRLMHLDERFFPNPEKFDPERFEKKYVKNAFLPFGWGPRKCIGETFALLEIKIMIATLLQKYEIIPADDVPRDLAITTGSHVKLNRKL